MRLDQLEPGAGIRFRSAFAVRARRFAGRMVHVKRASLALLLVAITAALAYGYTVTRQERLYRQLLLQGDAASARGETFAALAAFSDAIAIKPESMAGYLKRGEIHRRRGDLESAAVDLQRAAAIDPSSPRALELLGDLESARDAHDAAAGHYAASARLDDRPPVLYKLGLARYLSGATAAAAEALTAASALDSRFAEAQYLLGVCLLELDRPKEGEAALRRALALAPGLAPARQQLADLYGVQGRRAARLAELERLASDPADPARQITLALAYAENGHTTRAVRLLRRLTERYPDHPGASLALGRLWLDAAHSPQDHVELSSAVDALEQAVAVHPSATALSELARAYMRTGNVTGAAAALRQAAQSGPVEPEMYLRLAELAGRAAHRGTARDALVSYYALVDPASRRPGIALRIADLSMQLREPAVAVRWYQQAAADDDASPGVLLKLADAQSQTGDAPGARLTLQRLLEQEPAHGPARALLDGVR